MPGANDAVCRRGTEARRKTRRPLAENLSPRRFLEPRGEEGAPVGEAFVAAERGAPLVASDALAGGWARQRALTIALQRRQHGIGSTQGGKGFDRHRSMIGEAVLHVGSTSAENLQRRLHHRIVFHDSRPSCEPLSAVPVCRCGPVPGATSLFLRPSQPPEPASTGGPLWTVAHLDVWLDYAEGVAVFSPGLRSYPG